MLASATWILACLTLYSSSIFFLQRAHVTVLLVHCRQNYTSSNRTNLQPSTPNYDWSCEWKWHKLAVIFLFITDGKKKCCISLFYLRKRLRSLNSSWERTSANLAKGKVTNILPEISLVCITHESFLYGLQRPKTKAFFPALFVPSAAHLFVTLSLPYVATYMLNFGIRIIG